MGSVINWSRVFSYQEKSLRRKSFMCGASAGISFDPVFSAGNTHQILGNRSVPHRFSGLDFSKNEAMLGKSSVSVLTSGLSCNTCQIRVLTSVGFAFLSQDV